MSSPPPRTARPWLALLAGVALVAIVLVVLQALGGDEEPVAEGGDPVRVAQPRDPPLQLPDPADGARDPLGAPEPLEGRPEPAADPLAGSGVASEYAVVFGRVVDALAQPMGDVEVNLHDDLGEYLDSAISEEDGSFLIEWDEPLVAGWSLGTEPDAAADPEDPTSLGPVSYVHPADLVPGDPAVEVVLTLTRAPRLAGVVLDGLTREPVEFADVELVSLNTAWLEEFQDTFTEEDGTFAISLVDLPPSRLLLRVLDDDRVALIGPLDLAPGEERWLEILLHAPRTITGHLLDSRTGAPLENGEVQVLPLHDAFDNGDAWDLSYEDGNFTIEFVENPPEQTWIYAEAENHGPALVQMPRGRDELDLRLGPVGLLFGRVTVGEGEDAEPVEGAMVRAILRGPGGRLIEDYEDVAFTDADGRYELEFDLVPPSAAELIVEGDDTVVFRSPLSALTAVSLAGATELDVTLRPLPGP